MASFNESEKPNNLSALQPLSRNNSFYNKPYDSGGEFVEGKKMEEVLDSANCTPVSDIVIEKLRQHVKQLESKLQVAYTEIERLKLRSNPLSVKVEGGKLEKNETEGITTEPLSYTFYSHASPVTAVQQDETLTRNSGNSEVITEGVGNKGTPNSSRTKTSRYWSSEEHARFLEGLELYGAKDIRAISNYVGTRSSTQVRTHAQKYYLRLAREILRKQPLGSEVVKDKVTDKMDDLERVEHDPSCSGSSDFSVDEVCYDSLSGMKIPKAALEIAKQEARRLGSKGVRMWKKGSYTKNPDGDSFDYNSYVNSPVFSEGHSGSNIDWDELEHFSPKKDAISKRSRATEDVSHSSNVRAKHNNYSMDVRREPHEFNQLQQRNSHSEEATDLDRRPFSISDDLTWQFQEAYRDRKVEEGLSFWQDSLVDTERHAVPHFGHLDEPHKQVDHPKQLNSIAPTVLPRLEREEPNFWVFSQHDLAALSNNRDMRTFGLDNVALDDERNVYRSNDSRCSDGIKRSDYNYFWESKLPFPFHSESLSFHGSMEAERSDLEQSLGSNRTPSFPKMFSKPFLSASFSSLGELEDTHNLEQAMFGAKSTEEIRE